MLPGDAALQELDRARRKGLPLNITTYNSALSECWRGGRWRQALDLYQDILKEGERVRPNRYTFNSVIGCCARGGKYEIAEQVLEDMRKEGLEADDGSYNAVIGALARRGLWRKGLAYLNEMKSRGHAPTKVDRPQLQCAKSLANEIWQECPTDSVAMSVTDVCSAAR